jgi:hypothetical protein
MKQIFKYIGIAAFACSMFTSCSDDDVTGLSTIDYSPVTVTLTSSENNITIDETTIGENGYVITVTATIDNPLPIDIIVPLTQTGGTATAEDFSFGSIRIPSSLTSASTEVIINQTGNLEGNETLSIGAVDNSMITNASVNPFSLDVNIENDYVDYTFTLNFDWSGYVFPEEDENNSDLPFCDMDLDFLLIDASFSDTGNYAAATASCPEELVLDGRTVADGVYYIYAELYANPYSSSDFGVQVPLTITASQGAGGSIYPETVTVPSFTFNTNDADGNGSLFMEFEFTDGIVTSITIN